MFWCTTCDVPVKQSTRSDFIPNHYRPKSIVSPSSHEPLQFSPYSIIAYDTDWLKRKVELFILNSQSLQMVYETTGLNICEDERIALFKQHYQLNQLAFIAECTEYFGPL